MTDWFVITGGPSTGKTATLNALRARGYHTVEETARIHIDRELNAGRSIDQIRHDPLAFQRAILALQQSAEKRAPTDRVVFFDRALPDSLAYYTWWGAGNDEELHTALRDASYTKVFLLDLIPYEYDYARTESPEERAKIHALIHESYVRLQHPVVTVPVLPLEERVTYILNHVQSTGIK